MFYDFGREKPMNALLMIFRLIGSIAVCLVGLSIITDTLLARFSPWFKRLMADRRADRIHGFMNGMLASAVTGSSSSGVVFLISMVESNLVSLKKTPWIFMGINLGASFAGWLIALGAFHAGMTSISLVVLAAAFPFKISSYLSQYKYGDALTGIGLLLLGIDLLNGTLQLIPHDPVLIYYLRLLSGSSWGGLSVFLFGAVVSFLIQSSIGVQILAMSLAFRGWVPFDMAAAMVLGSNLGVTVTGFYAGSSLGINSRRAACIYLMINLVCCIWAGLVFPYLLQGADWIMPGYRYIPADILFRLAFFQTAVHLLNPLAAAALSSFMVKGSIVLVSSKRKPMREKPSRSLHLLPKSLPDSLDSNIVLIQSSLVRMAEWAYEMLMIVMNTSQGIGSAESMEERIEERRESIESLNLEIAQAGMVSVQQPCSRHQAEKIQHQLRVSQELKDIGDACFKSMKLLVKCSRGGYRFHDDSRDELFDFISQVLDFLGYMNDYLGETIIHPDAELAKQMEDSIDAMRDALKKRSRNVLEDNKDAQVKGELAFIEIIGYLEHIGDSCLRISETIPKMKVHEKRQQHS